MNFKYSNPYSDNITQYVIQTVYMSKNIQQVINFCPEMNKLPMRYLLFIKLMMVFVLLTVTAKSQIANKGGHTMSFSLSSPAFEQGNRIPTRHTCEGEDTSPFLQWSAAPEGTKSFALSCLDPDAPPGTWVHWVLYDLSADTGKLEEDVPKSEKLENGALQGACWGVDSFSRFGYYGPCPPPGHGDHRYYFRLYALNIDSLSLPPNATWFQVEKAMVGHIISTAELMGAYSR